MSTDATEATRLRAYHIWERDGRPQGRDAEHWAEAESAKPKRVAAAKSAKPRVNAASVKPAEPVLAKLVAKSSKRAKPVSNGVERHVH